MHTPKVEDVFSSAKLNNVFHNNAKHCTNVRKNICLLRNATDLLVTTFIGFFPLFHSLLFPDIYFGFYHLKDTHPLTTSFSIYFSSSFPAATEYSFRYEQRFWLKMTAQQMKQVECYVTLHQAISILNIDIFTFCTCILRCSPSCAATQ